MANFVIVPALAYGCQLALGALGVTLIYGILRFSNFAHGDLMAFGDDATILFTWWLQANGISFGHLPTALLALPAGDLVATAIICHADRQGGVPFYRKRKRAPVVLVIASVGVMFMLNGHRALHHGPTTGASPTASASWSGARIQEMERPRRGAGGPDDAGDHRVVTLVVRDALFWFLNRTRTGKAMRAYSDNEDLALLSGINPDRSSW
jgi:branched-chain amino acid transport system permease protein